MIFVDGENLTLRAQKLAKNRGVTLKENDFWRKDILFWRGNAIPTYNMFLKSSLNIPYDLAHTAIRSYYYTALSADDVKLKEVSENLRRLRFDPRVFRKVCEKSKGVDISLSRDMLSHAYQDHYDVAILFAGDGDYLPLIDEVKRCGKVICVCFFTGDDSGLSDDVKLSADYFVDINDFFLDRSRA